MTIRNIRFALGLVGVAVAITAQTAVAQSAGRIMIRQDTARFPVPSDIAVMEQLLKLQLLESGFAQMMREFTVEIQGTPNSIVMRSGPSPIAYQNLQRLFLDATLTLDRLCAVPSVARTAVLGITYLEGPEQTDATVKVAQYPKVIHVERGSPADKAGIISGDVIVKVDGKDLREVSLPQFIKEPGKVVSFSLDRAGSAQHVKAVLGKPGAPQTCELAVSSPSVRSLLHMDSVVARHYKSKPIDTRDTVRFSRFLFIDSGRASNGVRSGGSIVITNGNFVATPVEFYGAWFAPMVASPARGAVKPGVLVRMVLSNTQADRGGLKKNDIVTRVGKKTVTGMQDLKAGLEAMGKQSSVEFEVIRDEKPQVLKIPMK